MKLSDISSSVTRGFRSLGLTARRHGPTGLVIAGGVVMAAAVVQAVRDTRNGGGEVLDEYDKTVKHLKDIRNDDKAKAYGDEQYKKDIRAAKHDRNVGICKTYKKTGMKMAVAFGLAATGYVIRCKQLKNTAAALATTAASFAGYRANVIEDQGEEKDFEYLHNIKSRKVEKTEVDPETGEEKKVEEEVKVVEDTGDPDIPGYSRWARFFDPSCSEWEKDPSYNLSFLLARQAEANRRLQRDGYLFLNDVYEMLGIPKTYEGQIFGWLYKKHNHCGDNYVDFGIHDEYKRSSRDFVNGYEPTILLDFNVDGDILNTFPKPKKRK